MTTKTRSRRTRPPDPDTVKARLLDRLAELDRLDAGNAEALATVAADQGPVGRLSRMDALQDQAMARETHRRRALERTRIGQALHRIDTGEYGACVACGEPIAPRRLELDPTAPTCIRCAG